MYSGKNNQLIGELKICVLRVVLNLWSDVIARMCDGSPFHSFGAAAENARSPYVAVFIALTEGGCSNLPSDVDDRSFLDGV